jgi:glutathione S-transferase
MLRLTQFRLCPLSRSIRLIMGELAMAPDLVEERPWEYRPAFLALNPAGELPVLQMPGSTMLCGAYAIAEYLAEEVPEHPRDGRSVPLFPGNREERAEVRRLIDWFHRKMDREVTRELLLEKVYPLMSGRASGGAASPDPEVLRAVRSNLRYHLGYIGYLADQRRWLAGEELSFADFAAAAHLSVADYLSEVPWDAHPIAKVWYQRVKSRRAFRPLLADRIPGVPPPLHYTDLDF